VLTKRMAEDLTDYLAENHVRVRYLHSDIDTVERVEIIRDLRLGEFDVLVGINLLREGLDMPEVSLVTIFDADKEGFLRSEQSLIQTIGRAARNVKGKAILYADKITGSMQRAIDETERRRAKQIEHNEKLGQVPKGIIKSVADIMEGARAATDGRGGNRRAAKPAPVTDIHAGAPIKDVAKEMAKLEAQMYQHARDLEFEQAAAVRDRIDQLKEIAIAG